MTAIAAQGAKGGILTPAPLQHAPAGRPRRRPTPWREWFREPRAESSIPGEGCERPSGVEDGRPRRIRANEGGTPGRLSRTAGDTTLLERVGLCRLDL
jgi:hypothetical protein